MQIDGLKFEKIKKYSTYIIAFTTLIIYAILSAKSTVQLMNLGWEDEARFWLIVKNCTIAEIFSLMKSDGHMLIWYLLIKPFTKFLPYPHPMHLINWLFCLGAMIILWIKAPFNILVKIGMTLSPVFIAIHAPRARCYGIGFVFLFLACAMYSKRLERPYLYFILLAIAANTSFVAMIAASALGALFLFELYYQCYSSKTSYKKPLLITVIVILIGIMYYFQFNNFAIPDYETIKTNITALMNPIGTFLGIEPIDTNNKTLLYQVIGLRCFVLTTMLIFATRFKGFFVYFSTMALASMFFLNIYRPRIWHLAFFFIYFIVSYWIFLEEKPSKIAKNTLLAISIVFLICFQTMKVLLPISPSYIYQFLKPHNEIVKQGKVFTFIDPIKIVVSLPRLNEEGVYLYDINGYNLSTYKGLFAYFKREEKRKEKTNIYNHLDKNKPNYLISGFDINEIKDFKEVKNKLIIKNTIDGVDLYLFEIMKK